MLLCCNMYVPSVYETTYSLIAARSRIRKHVFSGQRLVNEWPLECADSACWLKLNAQSQHVDSRQWNVQSQHVDSCQWNVQSQHVDSHQWNVQSALSDCWFSQRALYIETGLCVQIREIVHTHHGWSIPYVTWLIYTRTTDDSSWSIYNPYVMNSNGRKWAKWLPEENCYDYCYASN